MVYGIGQVDWVEGCMRQDEQKKDEVTSIIPHRSFELVNLLISTISSTASGCIITVDFITQFRN